jgi:hypothetical protein
MTTHGVHRHFASCTGDHRLRLDFIIVTALTEYQNFLSLSAVIMATVSLPLLHLISQQT